MAGSSIGVEPGSGLNIDTYTVGGLHRERWIQNSKEGFRGVVTSYRMPGIGSGGGAYPIMTLLNKTGSTKTIKVYKATCDLVQTAASTVGWGSGVIPPVVTAIKFVPSGAIGGGTVRTPVSFDTTYTVNASTEVRDSSSGSDGSALNLITGTSITAPANGLSQEFAPRLFNLTGSDTIGYEKSDSISFISSDKPVELAANECFCIYLRAVGAALGTPTTFWFTSSVEWIEYS